MEELIFFAIIIIFSIIDSVARSRKKKRQGTGLPAPSEPSQPEWEWEDDVETYDSDGSYDDDFDSDEKPLPAYTRPHGSGSGGTTAKSSEGMIPTDIWEEIAGLATGREAAEPEPRIEEPVEIEPIPMRPVGTHRVHRSHAGYGTDPSSRPRSELDALDPLAVRQSADVREVRRQLHRGSHALRRAVILQEVLGQPAALRPDRFED